VYAIHSGSHIYPNNYAVWIEQVEVETKQDLQDTPAANTAVSVKNRA
jgi:membrane protein